MNVSYDDLVQRQEAERKVLGKYALYRDRDKEMHIMSGSGVVEEDPYQLGMNVVDHVLIDKRDISKDWIKQFLKGVKTSLKLEEPVETKPVETKIEEPVETKPVETKLEEPVETKLEEPVETKPEEPVTHGKKKRKPSDPNSKRVRRAQKVKAIMKERGVKLSEASKLIKDEGIEY